MRRGIRAAARCQSGRANQEGSAAHKNHAGRRRSAMEFHSGQRPILFPERYDRSRANESSTRGKDSSVAPTRLLPQVSTKSPVAIPLITTFSSADHRTHAAMSICRYLPSSHPRNRRDVHVPCVCPNSLRRSSRWKISWAIPSRLGRQGFPRVEIRLPCNHPGRPARRKDHRH
jgi:hypothetical protein